MSTSKRRPIRGIDIRIRLFGAVLIAGALVVTLVFLFTNSFQGAPTSGPTPSDALGQARRACAVFDQFDADVKANRASDRVLSELDRAVDVSGRAATANVRYVPLSSGLQDLRNALATDDASAARTGVDVVRHECAATVR